MTKGGASSNPGFTVAVNPAQQSQCALSSTGVGAAGAYAVTVSVTDSPIVYSGQIVVPANTITIPAPLSLTVNPAITFSVNFDNYSFTPTGAGTTAEVPDAVQGRTYGAVGPYGTATAGGETSLMFTASGGLMTTQGLTFTLPTPSPLPSPVQCGPATGASYPQVSTTTATMVCSSGGTAVATAGAFPFAVTVADAGNTATPTGSTMTDTLGHSSHTLKVDAPLTFSLAQAGNPTAANPTNLLDAVSGRTYGVVGGTPTYTPTGGLGANAGAVGNDYYLWCISTGTLPATFSSAGNNLNAPCTAQVQSPSETLQATSAITGAANPYPFTVQLSDTGNPTTPGASVTNSATLTVQPPLVATLAQNGNANVANGLLPGVYNRTYGVGGGTPTFTAAGGLGGISAGLGGNYQWCLSAGALPTGFLNTGTNLNNTSTCASPVVENTATLMASPITQNVATPASYSFTVRLDDGGNAAVPSGILSGTTNVVNSSILVNPQVQLAQSLSANWPDAVNGRAYGSGSNCTGGNCAPATYTATYGLGGYVWPTTPASILAITGMSCSVVSTTYQCSAADITAAPSAAGATSQSYSPSATVTDTPNAATPAATVATDPNSTRTDTLWVDAPLLATLNQNGSTNPGTLIPGVSGRSYGVVGATPAYTAAGGLGQATVGLGHYQWCISAGGLPAGFLNSGSNVNTPCTSPDVENAATLSASNISATITPPSQNFPFTVELDDPGNGSTPSSISSSTGGRNATSLLINAPLAINLTQAGNAASPNPASLLPAVTNRTYGSIGGTPTYTASYGLGGYTFPASPGPFGSGSGFTCSTTTTNPYVCSASPVALAASATSYPLSLTVTDTANPAVPNGSATSTTSLLVNPQMQLAQSLSANWPDAVNGRAYGSGSNCTGGNCAPATYTATYGLGGYVWPTTPASILAITGMSCSVVSTTYQCSAADITAAPSAAGATSQSYSPSATVTDTPNAATPAATVATDPNSTRTDTLWVDAPLLATLNQNGSTNPGTLIPGVSGRSYGVVGATPAYTAAGGLGQATVGLGHYQWCISAGGLPAGFLNSGSNVNTPCTSPDVENAATLSASNISATITPPSQNFPFTVELDDPGNGSTPSSVGSSTSATRATSVVINAPLAIQLTQASSTNPTSLLPGVTGRSYGTINGGAGAPTYTASYGLGGYTFPTSPGPFSTVAGFACSSATTNPYVCSANTSVSASPATYSGLSLTVTDTANPAVPQGNASVSTSLLVNSQLTLSTNLGPNWPDAVNGRAYGQGTGCTTGGAGNCTAMIYTAANGLGAVGGYTFPVINNFPTSLSPGCASASPTLTCKSAQITDGAGTFHPTVTAVDVANEATPVANTTTDPQSTRGNTDTLIVDPPLGVTLTQNTPGVTTNPASLLPGVAGRSYGLINGGGATPTYAAAGGLGATNVANYEWCVDTGASSLPAGLTGISGVGASAAHCAPYGPTGTGTATLSSANITATLTPPSQNFPFTVELDDTGNVSTPSSASSATEALRSTGLLINAALAVSSNYASNAFPDGVVNRHYGDVGTTCGAGACAPITYTASYGLPAYTYTTITNNDAAPAGAWPSNINCSPAAPTTSATYTCAATTGIATGVATPPQAFTPSVTVTDTGNYATPNGSLNVPGSLNVDAGLALALKIGNFPYAAGTAWPVGVLGRPYGSGNGCTGGAACAPPIFTATNGLGAVGGYTFSNDASLTGVGFTCNTSSPSLTCSATDLTSGFTPSVTATDVANTTTPAATTTTDPNSIFTSTNPVTANPELTITNTFLENATVGEPYSAILDSNRMGLGSPYLWCAGTISNGVCTPSGGIEGVSFVTPSPAITDDPSGNIRGYYQGTPTTPGGASTTISLSDEGNATTPACSWVATCPPPLALTTAATKPKVFNPQGFVANSIAESLLPFNFSSFAPGTAVDLSASGQHPITPRVTPDGQWVYVAAQSAVSVVDPTTATKAVPDFTFTTTGTSATSPTGLDVEPQQYFTAIPTACSTNPCSNLTPFIRYDAWLVDWASTTTPVAPTLKATVQPIPEAENPGMLPTALVGANSLTVAYAYGIAVTPDAKQAWVTLDHGCLPVSVTCNTLVPLTLPALSSGTATTYPATAGTTFGSIGLNGGPVAADPRGNYVYSVQYDKTNTLPYIAVATTAASDPPVGSPTTVIGYLPHAASDAGTVQVCQTGGNPTALDVSPDGTRLYIACRNEPNNYVEAWDVSQGDGALLGSDITLTAPLATVLLPVSEGTGSGGPANAENGCAYPIAMKSMATSTVYGTRLFVSCYNSDTIVPIDYNSGLGSNTLDKSNVNAVISTDAAPIANSAVYTNPCAAPGSCPYGIDLTPNPALHFITGGFAPISSPVAMLPETNSTPYYQYVAVAGGALPLTWSNPDGVLASDPNCAGLTLNASTGEIYGTAANTSVTCGGTNGFIIRVTDGSGQFVERAFTITIH
jgi:hypothetical protein